MDNPTNPIVGEVLTALRRLIRAVDLQSKRISRDYGATIPQMIVLQEIQKIGIASAAEIAMAVSLSQATVTSILTRLEGRGLILRLRSNQDRRKVELSVTEKGLRLLTSSPKLLHDKFISEFAKLERWEQLQILSSILRLAEMMDTESLDAAPLLAPGELKEATLERTLATEG
jgi:DNA-binding MarR family transcriptional regulator